MFLLWVCLCWRLTLLLPFSIFYFIRFTDIMNNCCAKWLTDTCLLSVCMHSALTQKSLDMQNTRVYIYYGVLFLLFNFSRNDLQYLFSFVYIFYSIRPYTEDSIQYPYHNDSANVFSLHCEITNNTHTHAYPMHKTFNVFWFKINICPKQIN